MKNPISLFFLFLLAGVASCSSVQVGGNKGPVVAKVNDPIRAQIYREKLGKAARAIEIYKDILKADPTDAVSMRAVGQVMPVGVPSTYT